MLILLYEVFLILPQTVLTSDIYSLIKSVQYKRLKYEWLTISVV